MRNRHLTRGLFAAVLSVWSSTSSADTVDSSPSPDRKPVVFMIADDVGTVNTLRSILTGVKAELGHGYSTASLEDIGQSDMRFYVLLNWAGLDIIDGLQDYCGDECIPNGTMSFSRVIKYSGNRFVGKDVFINLSRFVRADANGANRKIEDANLDCLAKVIAREIRAKNTYRQPVLGCHSALFKGKVSTVRNELRHKNTRNHSKLDQRDI